MDAKEHVPRTRAQQSFRNEHFEATAFLYAIVEAADRLKAARNFSGDPALRFDARWRLLRAIEKCGGCPSFADVAKLLRVRRQAVRELVVAAERAGEVELLADPHDRRAWQVALTSSGRCTLEAWRMPALTWTLTLLNGLDPAVRRSAAHVLRVVAQRLAGYEREMLCRSARRKPLMFD